MFMINNQDLIPKFSLNKAKMPENQQKLTFRFFQTIKDEIFGIFSVADNYNEHHKSF